MIDIRRRVDRIVWPVALVVTLILILAASIVSAQGTFPRDGRGIPAAPGTAQVSNNCTGCNSKTVSAANTALTLTLTPGGGESIHLYGVSFFCSAGTATITVESPVATTIWTSTTGYVDTTFKSIAWTPAALTTDRGVVLKITISTCGAGNTSTLNAQADSY